MQKSVDFMIRRMSAIACGCGIATAGFGVVGLASRLMGLLILTSYFENAIPMAMSTASLFCLIGAILIFSSEKPCRSRTRFILAFLALIIFSEGFMTALEVPLHRQNNFNPLDKLFFGIQSRLSLTPVGMSPLVGLLFGMTGVALLILVLRPRDRGSAGPSGAGLTGATIALAGLTLFLGYFYGSPVLYGSGYIPVAASSALAFVVAGSGIVCASGAEHLPLRPFLEVSIRSRLLRVFTPTIFSIVLIYPLINLAMIKYLRINDAILGSVMATAFAGLATIAVYRIGAGLGQQMDRAQALRRSAEERLAQTNAYLGAKNAELEQVVYVASHDLRSPLVNIDGYSRELGYAFDDLRRALAGLPAARETLQTISPLLEEDIPEALRFIRTSASKMDSLLTGLLRLSRSGRAALNIETLNMNKLIAKTAEATEFKIKQAGITLEVADLPACRGDTVQVSQVFSNLLDNAIKYLDPARPGVIRIHGRLERERTVYCVEDNGIGIAPAHLNKIFEIFHRLDPARSPGEGLGLAIVKRILARLGGEVWVESDVGVGSRFCVALPAAETH